MQHTICGTPSIALPVWCAELNGVGEEGFPLPARGTREWQQPVTEAAPLPGGGAVQWMVWIVYDGQEPVHSHRSLVLQLCTNNRACLPHQFVQACYVPFLEATPPSTQLCTWGRLPPQTGRSFLQMLKDASLLRKYRQLCPFLHGASVLAVQSSLSSNWTPRYLCVWSWWYREAGGWSHTTWHSSVISSLYSSCPLLVQPTITVLSANFCT